MIKPIKRGVNRLVATLTLLSLELLVVLLAFFSSMAVFILIARMIFWKKKQDFDSGASTFISGFVSDTTTDIMQFFSFLGSHYFLIPANLGLVCFYLFVQKHRWYSIKIPVVAISSTVLMFLLKFIFQRQRPLVPLLEAARGLSFPSGHAMMSFTFYGLIIYLVWKNMERSVFKVFLITCLLLIIHLIGLSRIYLNVHYASDVIAGFSLGFMWLVLCITILDKMEKYSKRHVKTAPPTVLRSIE